MSQVRVLSPLLPEVLRLQGFSQAALPSRETFYLSVPPTRAGRPLAASSGRCEAHILRFDRAGRPPRGLMIAPVEICVRDDQFRRRRAPGREILGRMRIADERRVIAANECAVQRRTHAFVRLRADDDSPDGEVPVRTRASSPRTSPDTASGRAARSRPGSTPGRSSIARFPARGCRSSAAPRRPEPPPRELSRRRCRHARRRCPASGSGRRSFIACSGSSRRPPGPLDAQ